MSLPGALAIVDGLVALVLLLSVPRQRENKVRVLIVAAVLIGVCGWLAVLALDYEPTDEARAQVPTVGPVA